MNTLKIMHFYKFYRLVLIEKGTETQTNFEDRGQKERKMDGGRKKRKGNNLTVSLMCLKPSTPTVLQTKFQVLSMA